MSFNYKSNMRVINDAKDRNNVYFKDVLSKILDARIKSNLQTKNKQANMHYHKSHVEWELCDVNDTGRKYFPIKVSWVNHSHSGSIHHHAEYFPRKILDGQSDIAIRQVIEKELSDRCLKGEEKIIKEREFLAKKKSKEVEIYERIKSDLEGNQDN